MNIVIHELVIKLARLLVVPTIIKNQDDFVARYFDHVFVKGKSEYLTEKQLVEDAPLAVDIDMRYETDIEERQHTKEHIVDAIDIYAKIMSQICDVEDGQQIEVFVMEKSTVNRLDTKTKDGIHMIFGVGLHRAAHVLIRDKVMPQLKEIWDDLPLTNTVDDLIDEGITRGTVNWQLYGSKKPNQGTYLIKYHFMLVWGSNKEMWEIEEKDIETFNTKKYLPKLSVRCTEFPKLSIKTAYQETIEKLKTNLNKKRKSSKMIVKASKSVELKDITSMVKLDELVTQMLDTIEQTPMDYELKETHQFVMILPDKYWGPGSYSKWIRVGWALKNTSLKLLPTWLKFSSKSKEFTFADIPSLIEMWNKFDYENPDGLTTRSIMYWAKNDNKIEYNIVRQETISHYIEKTEERQARVGFRTSIISNV